jgi:hypothetical protein
MKHDLSLPPPGAIEPEGKPSKDVKLGQKPVLPPPAKPLDEEDVKKAAQKPKTDAVAVRPPAVAVAPPADLRVEREPVPPPPPQPMKREKSKSGVSKAHKKKKAPQKAAAMMDDEIAVVTRDPRKSRSE